MASAHRGALGRSLVAVALVLAAVAAGPARAATLEVSPPTEHSSLRAGTLGGRLSVTLVVRDAAGRTMPGVAIHVTAPERGGAPVVVVEPDVIETDGAGHAQAVLRLDGPPGDYSLLVVASVAPDRAVEIPVRILRSHWLRFLIMGVAGGLALFLFGMRLLGRDLEQLTAGRIREILGSLTANRARSVLFGAVSTLLVQSSSASTVFLVSFASAGLISVGQALGALLGAAVASTFTVQLIAFRISDFALLLVAVGFALTMSRSRRSRTRVGGILLGFGLVFYGLQVMTSAMAPLKGLPEVAEFFVAAGRDPIPALLAAVVFTGIAQASAATIGLILGLAFQGILTLEAAVPFVLGANIGTATTALLASVATNADGKRVALAHAGFRVLGVLLVLPLLGPFVAVVERTSGDLARQVANAHTLFNLVTALVLLPLLPVAESILRRIVKDDPTPSPYGARALDPRFHEQPSIALASALREVLRMGGIVTSMVDDVRKALRTDDEELARSIQDRDDRVDVLDEQITHYLADLSTESLSPPQSDRVVALLFVTKDLELIADIASKALVPGVLRKKREHGLYFSDEGFQQILEFHDGVREDLELAVAAVATWDRELARQVLEKKKQLSQLERRFQISHLDRLRAGNEEARATTTVHVDAMNDLKRIVGHTARIAYAVLGKVYGTRDSP